MGDSIPTQRVVLTRINAGGEVDASFADGGVKILGDPTDPTPVAVVSAGEGKSLVATRRSLTEVNADGSTRVDFNVGRFGDTPITTIERLADGTVVAAGGSSHFGIVVARFLPGGQPDPAFGDGGFVNLEKPASMTIFEDITASSVDLMGRVVLAGNDAKGAALVRLLSNGMADDTFGPNGDGSASTPQAVGASATIDLLTRDAEGGFGVYGVVSQGGYSYPSFVARFGSDGTPFGARVRPLGGAVFAATSDGGIISGLQSGRGSLGEYALIGTDGSDKRRFGPVKYEIGPGNASVQAVAYDAATDSLVATGTSSSYECAPKCRWNPRIAVTRSNAITGTLDPGFGIGGILLVPRNECGSGSIDSPRAYQNCRIAKPVPRTARAARVRHAASRRPSLRGTVTLPKPPSQPFNLVQRVRVKIPSRLGLRSEKIRSRDLLTADTSRREASAKIRGRTITLEYRPEDRAPDPYLGGNPPPNRPITFSYELKRGALKPISRKLLRKRLSFRVSATYLPQGDATKWWTARSTTKSVRVRPGVPTARPVKSKKRR